MVRLEENPFAGLTDYELGNLIAHLEAARKSEQLHRVLEIPTAAGRNAWYESQLALGDAGAYATDMARAWQVAQAADEIGLEVRYALVTSTLNNHAQDLPPELAVAALACGLWSGRRTIAFVLQLQDAATRAGALATIMPQVEASLRDEVLADLLNAIAAAGDDGTLTPGWISTLPDQLPRLALDHLAAHVASLTDPYARALAVRAVVPRLPEPARSQALNGALDAARVAPGDEARIRAYTELIPALDGTQLTRVASEVLAAASREGKDKHPRIQPETLASIAPFLAEHELDTALRIARSFGGWKERVRALAALAPLLSESLLADAVKRARTARAKQERVTLLAEFANQYSGPSSRELRDEALAAARTTPVHLGRATALAAVAVRLPHPEHRSVVDEAFAATPTADVLIQLIPCLSETQVEGAIAIARGLGRFHQRRVLAALWPWLSPGRRRGVLIDRLAAVRAETYEPFRIDGLAELLPLLSPAARLRAAGEALEAARSLDSGGYRARFYALLAPHLPPELLPDAIEAAQTINDRGPRSLLLLELATLAGVVPEATVLSDAFATARWRDKLADGVRVLADLAPHLPAHLLDEALRALTKAERKPAPDDEATAQALKVLVPHLPEALLPSALNIAESIEYLEYRAAALAALGPYLRGGLLERAVAAAREIPLGAHSDGRHGGGRNHKAEALAALAPNLPTPARVLVTLEAEATALKTPWLRARAETLAELAPLLPPLLRPKVIEAALSAIREGDIPDSDAAHILSTLIPYAPDTLKQEVLSAVRDLRKDVPRTRALMALARDPATASRARILNEALAAARSIRFGSMDDDVAQIALLVDIADLAPEAVRNDALHDALTVVLASENPAYRFEAGAGRLVPRLTLVDQKRVLERALSQARSWPNSMTKAETLFAIAPHLFGVEQVEVLLEALPIALREAPPDVGRFRGLLPPFTEVPADALRALWSAALHGLVAESRETVLHRLRELVALIIALGGPGAATATGDAVIAVTRWWS